VLLFMAELIGGGSVTLVVRNVSYSLTMTVDLPIETTFTRR
jgi:hypothetical protein